LPYKPILSEGTQKKSDGYSWKFTTKRSDNYNQSTTPLAIPTTTLVAIDRANKIALDEEKVPAQPPSFTKVGSLLVQHPTSAYPNKYADPYHREGDDFEDHRTTAEAYKMASQIAMEESKREKAASRKKYGTFARWIK
jgi:hypothetical protein